MEEFEVEETRESASKDAIEIGEKKAEVAKLEDKVIIPLIPDTLNIDGVELNVDRLKSEIAEVKAMKIDGITDVAGYDAAVEKLRKISKLRTGSNSWREKLMKPVLKFQRELKKKIDDAGELCAEGEKHLKAIIEPIDNYKQEEIRKAEEAKDALAVERAKLLMDAGVPFDGKGTYNSSLDAAVFFLHDDLRTYSAEDWDALYTPVKATWDAEQTRLNNLKIEEEQVKNKLQSEVEQMGDEIIEMRKEILDAKGYEFHPDKDIWFRGDEEVPHERVLNATIAEWKTIFAPKQVAVETKAEAVKQHHEPSQGFVGVDVAEPQSAIQPSTSFDIAGDFAVEEETTVTAEETKSEAVEETHGGPDAMTKELKAIHAEEIKNFNITIPFSDNQPFLDFKISGNIRIRLFHNEFRDLAFEGLTMPPKEEMPMDGIPNLYGGSGSVTENMSFFIIKN